MMSQYYPSSVTQATAPSYPFPQPTIINSTPHKLQSSSTPQQAQYAHDPSTQTPGLSFTTTTLPPQNSPSKNQNQNHQTQNHPHTGTGTPNITYYGGFTLTEITNILLQTLGFIIAAVFGAWAIKSYDSANIANSLSQRSLAESAAANDLARMGIDMSGVANVVGLLGVCLDDQFKSTPACSAVLEAMSKSLPSLVNAIIPSLVIPTASTSTTTSGTSSASLTSRLTVVNPPQTTSTLSGTFGIPPPTTTTTGAPNPNSSSSHHAGGGVGLGAIIGIIVGGIALVSCTAVFLVGRWRMKSERF